MVELVRVVEALEDLYPLRYAEGWDHPGLVVGLPHDEVSTIAFAVDPTRAVVEEAVRRGADLLVCHHPLLFRSVHEVSGLAGEDGGAHGAVIARLYRAGCALWVGHTNADVAPRGVGQAAADAFGLVDQRPLVPSPGDETGAFGLGRVGTLRESMTLRDFAGRVAAALPHTERGVLVAGDPEAPVSRVAVLPGSGDSLFDEVRASGADVYVTSDLRHHPALDARERARYEASLADVDSSGHAGTAHPMLVDTPHSAIESLWLRYAIQDVPDRVEAMTGVRPGTLRIDGVTDPWTLAIR